MTGQRARPAGDFAGCTALRPAIRIAAGCVALVAWVGLALQFTASLAHGDGLVATLWILGRYFTITNNLAIAIQLSGIALGLPVAAGRGLFTPRWLAGLTLAMALVGVVYGLLLDGLIALSGIALLADVILHKVMPVLAVLFWLGFAPKGRLTPRDPLIWALYPLAYLVYALARGAAEGIYAYPFLNLAKLGPTQTAINVALIGTGFMASGYAMLWLDRRLAGQLR